MSDAAGDADRKIVHVWIGARSFERKNSYGSDRSACGPRAGWHLSDDSNETIATPRKGFYEAWRFGGIPEGLAQAFNRVVDSVIEIERTDKQSAGDSLGAIRATLRETLLAPSFEQTLAIANPIGEGTVSIAVAPIGFGSDAAIIVGSRRPHFRFPSFATTRWR